MIFKTTPMQHQLDSFERAKDLEYWAHFHEMGSGKTKITIDQAGYLYLHGRIEALLVIAPNGIHSNWVKVELPKHCPVPYEALIWGSCGHDTQKWKGLLRGLMNQVNKLQILAMNIEALRTKAGLECARKFLTHHKGLSMVAVDEATCIKNHRAAQSKGAHKLRDLADYRRVLTGTPITQGPLDLFSLCHFLSRDAIPYKSFTAFRAMFAIEQIQTMGNRSFSKIVGYRNLENLRSMIQPFSDRLTKAECLDLPDKVYQEIEVEMTQPQQQAYEQMKNLCLLQLEEGLISANNVLTQMAKLAQIASGFIKDEDGAIHSIENNKMAMLQTLVESGSDSQKWIIWCPFIHNIESIQAKLADNYSPSSVVTYYGATSNDERIRAVRRFQEDPLCRFFVSNRTGSEGLTLTASSSVIYWGNTFRLDTRLQSEDRNHRIGQTNKVTYYDLITAKTIDPYILKKLRAKQDIANTVLNDWQEVFS